MKQKHLLNVLKKQKRTILKSKKAHPKNTIAYQPSGRRNHCTGIFQQKGARFSTIQGFSCPCQGRNGARGGYRIPGSCSDTRQFPSTEEAFQNHPLSKPEHKDSREISKEHIFVEHAIRFVKRFRIFSERYFNSRNCFTLCFSLTAGIYNFDRFA